jgi:primosomal protein N''
MSSDILKKSIYEIEKIEGMLELCINNLYDENSNNVAFILENINDNLSKIKNQLVLLENCKSGDLNGK